ncbi:hypothetical protein L0222_03480 [bacterium]|nr:hypothetical protein [bacterium]MCI0603131.1 hypothetical protein [bacterium]
MAINDRCSKAWSGLTDSTIAESPEYALRAVKYGPRDSYAHNNLGYFLNNEAITLSLEAYEIACSLDPL